MGGYAKAEPSPMRRETVGEDDHHVATLSVSNSRSPVEGAAGAGASRSSPVHVLTAQQSALDGRAIVRSHVSLQRTLDHRASASRPVVQRKIRSGAQVFDGTAAAASFGEPMHGLLTSNEIHVTNRDGGRSLEHGLRGPIKILSAHHHLIGEQHDRSRVASIEGDWAAAVPILYESLFPPLAGPSLKRPVADPREVPKAKPLEDIRVRAIYTIAHVSDLVAKAQKKLDPERRTLVSALAWLAETFNRYRKADFDTAAVLGDQGDAALAHGASVQKIRDHTKDLIGKLVDEAKQLRAGGTDLSPVVKLLVQLDPVKEMLLADVAADKPQSVAGGGNKPSQWDDAKTTEPLFQDLKLGHSPTYEPHYKYNALRDEHMVKAILAGGRPSIAIMGQAHLRAIQADWNHASFKFYSDVSAFNKAITVMIPLAPQPVALAAASHAAGGDAKSVVPSAIAAGGGAGAVPPANATTSAAEPAKAPQPPPVQFVRRTNVGYSSMESRAAVGSSMGAQAIGGLPFRLKVGIEHLSGFAMDDVRVHYHSQKPAAVQAHAYAQGTDIHLAPGQEKHLPHEAWHVVQQMQGRVKPTLQLKGIVINDDAGLEREADVMGARAAHGHAGAAGMERATRARPPVQRLVDAHTDKGHTAGAVQTMDIVQRKRVETNGGVFNYTEYAAVVDKPAIGANIKMTFLPKGAGKGGNAAAAAAVDAKAAVKADVKANAQVVDPAVRKVGMIQTNRRTIMVHGHDEGPPDRQPSMTEIEAARAVDRTHIDRLDYDEATSTMRQNNPVYQSADNTPASGDKGAWVAQSIADIPQPKHGQLWSADKPQDPAILIDKPRYSVEMKSRTSHKVIDEFETAAVVLEGQAQNTYLGSVKWGWEAQGLQVALRDFKLGKPGNPSARFLAAGKKWNEQKLDDKDMKMPTIKVPIPGE
ncbi:eCIS core domain-containing protein [Bradyrhizobium sp. 2TAF24]|uniref:eCIS core domain-containing protein n=1 Tax=Bradyrhizobium sp. 2TAF24 TaxID=3233011 RepID=UPI003F8F586E